MATENEPELSKETLSPQPIVRMGYDLIKSNYFRVVFAEGVFGGVSPSGYINMALFNERFPLPTHLEYVVTDAGNLGDEILEARVGRDSIIREVETEVVLSLDGAKKMHAWLGRKIDELTVIMEAISKKRQEG